MTAYSLLDLVPIVQGGSVPGSRQRRRSSAHAEALGYTRYWVAEHHGMDGIASAATSVVIAHVGQATSTIRIGAGGIMLPNHAPLQIAEQFGTLDALFPGRIDLGPGRAPGSDQRVAQAIRRKLQSDAKAFPQDVLELQSYFADDGQTGIRATPGAGARLHVDPGFEPVRRAARGDAGPALCLRLAFRAGRTRRGDGDVSPQFPALGGARQAASDAGFNVFAADSDEEAELLATLAATGVRLRCAAEPGPAAAAGPRLSREPAAAGCRDARPCPSQVRR